MPGAFWANALLALALLVGLIVLLTIEAEAAVERPSPAWLEAAVNYLAEGVEIVAVLVIGSAALFGTINYVRQSFSNPGGCPALTVETIRRRLGRILILGLEFTVAADILRTTVSPTRQDIVNLTTVIILRTLLNHFLELELGMQQLE